MAHSIFRSPRSLIIASAIALTISSPAAATVTYHLTGVNVNNSVGGYGVTYVGAHTPLTFDFTLAAPLAANLGPTDVVAQALSYRASGGQAESTITNLDYVGGFKQIELSTNALGAITTFHFHVVGQNLVLPNAPNFLDFNFQGFNGALSAENLLFYRNDAHFNYGNADCANANCGGGGFTVQLGGGVPEPATWALMVMGFGAVGLGLRRRRETVAA